VKLCECGCGQPAPIATRNRRGYTKGQPLRFISGHNYNPFPVLRGEDSPHWLGDDAGYFGLHLWLKKHHPKTGICAECGESKRTVWAFQRHPARHTRDIADYRELCHRCHTRLDDILARAWVTRRSAS